ncbi:MAG TPA: hypothetical protein DIT04_02270 [Dysgonomonas sp.]|nr:hypothetical protein [Dysgonomonas sp.]
MKKRFVPIVIIFIMTLASCDNLSQDKYKNHTNNENVEIEKNDQTNKYAQDIAKYVYLETMSYNSGYIVHNKTDYTIDKILLEFVVEQKPYSVGTSHSYSVSIEKNYISANSSIKIYKEEIIKGLSRNGYFETLSRGEIKLIKSTALRL